MLITGASSGIGRELARRICVEARRVILVARRKDRLDALADELRKTRAGVEVEVVACDLAVFEDLRAMCDRVLEQGPVDVLINNAGFGDRAYVEQSDWEKMHRMIAVNVTAVAYLCRRMIEGMIERGHGGVMNVGSVLGRMYQPSVAQYAGSKHFVWGFTEALRSEVAGAGVTVTQVCPGPVATEFRLVAMNRTAVKQAPGFWRIEADDCAEEALRAFRRGRAVVYPGRVNKLIVALYGLVPRFVMRWLMARSGAKARAAMRVDSP